MLPHTLCHRALKHNINLVKQNFSVGRSHASRYALTGTLHRAENALLSRRDTVESPRTLSTPLYSPVKYNLTVAHTHDCIMHPFCTRVQFFFVGPHTSMTCNAHLHALLHTHAHPSAPSQVCRRPHKSCRHPRLRAINPTTELTYKHRCRSGRES